MILTDTGPLVALLDEDDPHHAACRAATFSLGATPFLTTWPCFTEAMYLLGAVGGFAYQSALWNLRRDRRLVNRRLVIWELSQSELARVEVLMAKYQDLPMDLADATLVALAESGGIRRILTIDSDFRIYRLQDGSSLEVIPS